MTLYCATDVLALQRLYGPAGIPKQGMLGKHLQALATLLWQGIQQKKAAVLPVLANASPAWVGLSAEGLAQAGLTPADALEAVCRDHGFTREQAAEALEDRYFDPDFERALCAMLTGDAAGLGDCLDSNPHLAKARSPFGHGATLLHYAATNGVETHRQQVPSNLADLVWMIRHRGADPTATAYAYGGTYIPLALASSSGHPRDAGLAEALEAALDPNRTP